jgi:hypothetical protein
LFFKGVIKIFTRFPKSAKLRIAYAFFLIERLGKKYQKKALEELAYADMLKPSLYEEFLIFRQKYDPFKNITFIHTRAIIQNQSGDDSGE